MDRWLIGPGINARSRLELMKLAWDITGTQFGSRAGLYERLYSGDPELNAHHGSDNGDCEALVQQLLQR